MLLGIDIGTSSVKAVLVGEDGAVVRVASSPLEVSRPREGWSEQRAGDWWDGTVAAVREVTAGAPEAGVRAVGLSGQMHGSVLLDAASVAGAGSRAVEALRPPLLWNDQRTAVECAEIAAALGGRAGCVRTVGNAAITGFTLPKLLWVRRHESAVWASVAGVCMPKDFVRLQMTGELATDVGDGAGTLLFDVLRRQWNVDACAAVRIDVGVLPPVLESCAVAGSLTPWAAGELGLPAGTPVVAGSGDNMTGAAGAGVVAPGQVLATLGTSGVIYAHADAPRLDLGDPESPGRLHTMCAGDGTGPGDPGGWCVTGCMLSAAGALHWARDVLAPESSFDSLLAEAAAVPAGCEGLVFLPYLTGERCPYPDPDARGGWIGLTARHGREHLVRSVLEGVTFGMGQILDLVRGMKVPVERVRVGGGGAQSRLWREMLADVFGAPVATVNASEGSAFGAALMAGVGVGAWRSLREACAAVIRDVELVEPDAKRAAGYEAARAKYEGLYSKLRT